MNDVAAKERAGLLRSKARDAFATFEQKDRTVHDKCGASAGSAAANVTACCTSAHALRPLVASLPYECRDLATLIRGIGVIPSEEQLAGVIDKVWQCILERSTGQGLLVRGKEPSENPSPASQPSLAGEVQLASRHHAGSVGHFPASRAPVACKQ
jgi:hypothetical protein